MEHFYRTITVSIVCPSIFRLSQYYRLSQNPYSLSHGRNRIDTLYNTMIELGNRAGQLYGNTIKA